MAKPILGVVPVRVPVALVAVLAVWGLYSGSGVLLATERIDDELLADMDEADNMDVLIELKVAVTPFHIERYQTFGRVGGIQGTAGRTLVLMEVSPDGVLGIARDYWVKEVRNVG